MNKYRILLFAVMVAVLAAGAAGCGGGQAPSPSGGPQEQGQVQAQGPSGEQEPPVPGSPQPAGPGTAGSKGSDSRAFVHQFMRCRLLEPFGQRAYAMTTEKGRQAFVKGADPTLGGAPVMQRMAGYRLEDVVGGKGSWTATLTVWLTGPADKAESMFYREKLTLVPLGEAFAVDNWEPESLTQAYTDRTATTLYVKDAACGRERVAVTAAGIPVSFTPQGDNPAETGTSPGEFKAVSLFTDGRVAFATLGIFGAVAGTAAEGRGVQVLDRFDSWVNELVWAPGGCLLAVEVHTPSGRTEIVIYDVATGRRVYSLSEVVKEKGCNLTRGCWLADDRYFYFFSAVSGKGPQKLWKLDTGSGQVDPAQV